MHPMPAAAIARSQERHMFPRAPPSPQPQAAPLRTDAALPPRRTATGLVAGERDVELRVLGQRKGLANGVGELTVTLGAGLDLERVLQGWVGAGEGFGGSDARRRHEGMRVSRVVVSWVSVKRKDATRESRRVDSDRIGFLADMRWGCEPTFSKALPRTHRAAVEVDVHHSLRTRQPNMISNT